MDHRQRRRGHELDHEVAIRDGVERVRGHTVEAELAGRLLAVERVARAGQRASPQRREVGSSTSVGQPASVALEHLDIGQQVMGQQDRLGRLDVGRPWQNCLADTLGQADQGTLELEDGDVDPVGRAAQPQPQVGGDLVVARAARMELARERPDPRRQGRLEVEVDVLEGRIPRQHPGFDLRAQPIEPGDQRGNLVGGQQTGATQPVDMGDGADEVVHGERRVNLDRAGEVGHGSVGIARESPAPELHRPSVR